MRERDTLTTEHQIELYLIKNIGNVFATDAILALLMSAPRSIYSWDIVIQKVGGNIFLDKRDNAQSDYVTVNETCSSPPKDEDGINAPNQLAEEATFINQSLSQQVSKRK